MFANAAGGELLVELFVVCNSFITSRWSKCRNGGIGTVSLNYFSGENRDNEGMNFISAEPRSSTSDEVPLISLDRFCKEHQLEKIDFLKIDVQGYEPAVLVGACGLIDRGAIQMIFFELN